MKNLRKHVFMLGIIWGLCFLMVLSAHAATESGDVSTKSGWATENNHKVYYVNGKKFTKGWKKIGKYVYYLEKKTGYLAVNKIVGSKEKGYYYVGKDGIRLKDTAMNYAVKFILKNTKTSDSQDVKLKKCFTAMRKNSYSGMSQNFPSSSQISSYAIYMFKYHRGNCFRFAADMTYLTLALGYQTRMTVGGITVNDSKHSWCEVKCDSVWKIIDVSYQRRTSENLFMVERDEVSQKMKACYTYYPKISKGKISWEKTKLSWENSPKKSK